jgi:8-oxo-dGTP pyrophosphatase MutT (NUDIX family)
MMMPKKVTSHPMLGTEPKLFVATKAVISHGGKILIIRESGAYAEGTKIGHYDLPGGRLKPGEHFNRTLGREVFEETGLKIKVGKPIAVNESWPTVKGKKWQIVRMFFECRALSTDVKLSVDHDAYKWINPAEYKGANIIRNLWPVFEEYLRMS